MTRVEAGLAGTALLLGVGAAVAGTPAGPSAALDRSLPELVAEDRVTALDVAAWLRARRDDLTVLDVRPADADFEQFHLPRARHVPVPGLRDTALARTGTIVVYADGGDLAARAWVVLRAMGYEDVRVLPDGVREWLTDVLAPTLSEDASPAEREAFAAQADLSRYFGGLPRIVPAGVSADTTATAGLLRRASRRGCAF